MALYTVPFDYEANDSVIHLNSMGLSCLFYKSKQGQLGFCINDESTNILFNIIQHSTWFSIDGKFQVVNREIFEKNKYNMKGLFFLDKSEFIHEIFLGNQILKLKNDNKLLTKYNKELIQIPPNIIIDSFVQNVYDREKIEQILINKNVLLWNWSEFGEHIIFHRFNDCLLFRLLENTTIIEEKTIDNIPPW